MPSHSFKNPKYAPRYKTKTMSKSRPSAKRPPKKLSTADMAWILAKKAAGQVKKLKRVLNTEEKVFDVDSATAPGTSGTLTNLFNPAQGDTAFTREGDSTRPIGLEFKWFAVNNPANTTLTQTLRLILLRAYGEHNTAPTVATVLQGSTPDSPINYQNRERYTILYDTTFHITPQQGGQAATDGACVLRLSGHTLYTTGTTGVEDGGVYLLAINDSASDLATVNYYSRVWFTDT